MEAEKHRLMLDSIAAVHGKSKNLVNRTEVFQASEFIPVNEGWRVQAFELVKSLPHSDVHLKLRKQLQRAEKKRKTVSKPTERHEQTQTYRSQTYDQTKTTLGKWDLAVKEIKQAEQLKFPLERDGLEVVDNKTLMRIQPSTPMETEIHRLLNKGEDLSENVTPSITKAEEFAAMSLQIEEAKLKRKELQQRRARISYEQAKLARQKKIKSKSYHRILKKERTKHDQKSLDELKEKDPDQFIEKIADMEHDRIKERMSLKHKVKSRRLKKQAVFTKYNVNMRELTQDMLQKSKQLTHKATVVQAESDDDEISQSVTPSYHGSGSSNPWISGASILSHSRVSSAEPEELLLSQKRKHTMEDFEGDGSDNEVGLSSNSVVPAKRNRLDKSVKVVSPVTKINPEMLATVNSELEATDSLTLIGSESDMEQRLTIAQAFASDDVVEEFRHAKMAQEKQEKPIDFSLSMPGWGDWGGDGIVPSKSKSKRFTLKAPKIARSDRHKSRVIIRDLPDSKAAKYQLNTLPMEFTNAETYEAFIRQPLGKTWNPETVFKKLTLPKVSTKLGAVIEPITEKSMKAVIGKGRSAMKM